ncbi:hypothetical protein N9W17_04205 [Jannaschia sp.]|nr:hypothetical protein [Jannaschia sp.]
MQDDTPQPRFLGWPDDKYAVIGRLAKAKPTLRIFIKTKDDAEMLSKWYAHHKKIVPTWAITIFDNGSTDPDCLAFYAQLPPETMVVRFQGFHNGLHMTTEYPELYAALVKSCRYFTFIDCDEYLCHYDGQTLRMDESIVDPLIEATDDAIPTTRLDNYPGRSDQYPVSDATLKNGTIWGKPILRSNFIPIGHINHNCQISNLHYAAPFEAGYILLHLNRLDAEQRIKANLRKLKQRRFGAGGDMLSAALAADADAIADSATRHYVSEVQVLKKTPYDDENHPLHKAHETDGIMTIGESGPSVDFTGEGTQALLTAHMTTPAAQATIIRRKKKGARAYPYARRDLSHDPYMTESEGILFSNFLYKKSFLLEFGSGGSTVLAAAMRIPKIVSVDSSKEWLDSLSAAEELQEKDFTAKHVDIGPLANWGNPADTSNAYNWPTYYTDIWAELGDARPDIVLVDGRFRVACVLQTLLMCPPETIIVIHDFWKRDCYHVILKHLKTVARCDQLGIFKAKDKVDWRQLAIDLSHHSVDYR